MFLNGLLPGAFRGNQLCGGFIVSHGGSGFCLFRFFSCLFGFCFGFGYFQFGLGLAGHGFFMGLFSLGPGGYCVVLCLFGFVFGCLCLIFSGRFFLFGIVRPLVGIVCQFLLVHQGSGLVQDGQFLFGDGGFFLFRHVFIALFCPLHCGGIGVFGVYIVYKAGCLIFGKLVREAGPFFFGHDFRRPAGREVGEDLLVVEYVIFQDGRSLDPVRKEAVVVVPGLHVCKGFIGFYWWNNGFRQGKEAVAHRGDCIVCSVLAVPELFLAGLDPDAGPLFVEAFRYRSCTEENL